MSEKASGEISVRQLIGYIKTALGLKYSKPSGGIPKTDLAAGVVPEIDTDPNDAVWQIGGKVIAAQYDGDANEIHTTYATKSEVSGMATQTWVGQQGYQTATDVQTAIAPLQPKAITDSGNYFTTDTVEGALQEIGGKLLPSGGSAGDFLRKTASGVAWQTVPSAESNSFGGGA